MASTSLEGAALRALQAEHRNLRMLVAAMVVELGGVFEVPNSTLISVAPEDFAVEDLPERDSVRVHAR